MKNPFIVLIQVILAQATLAACANGAEPGGYLVPIDLKVRKEYRSVVESKLSVTPFDYGRAIVLPAFEGEKSVAVYSRRSRDGKWTNRVAFNEAEENLWQRTDGGKYPDQGKNVKIYRRDAEISTQTAKLLKEIWLQMLKHAHSEVASKSKWRTIELEGTRIEFSVQQPDGSRLYAELPSEHYSRNAPVAEIVKLAEDLAEYCKAMPSQRNAIESEILRKASQLLAKLH